MIENIVTWSIVNLNFRKITRGSSDNLQLDIDCEQQTLGSAGFWRRNYPCYAIDFLVNRQGLIRYFRNLHELPRKKVERYSLGSFIVALDIPRIHTELKAGIRNAYFPQERIIEVRYPSDISEKAKQRLEKTREAYNALAGFDPDYGGFTVGNFLDDDSLFL